MNKKLTLNIEDNLIKFAHYYSKRTNQSISSIIEKYLSRLKEETETDKISTEAKELYGILEKEPLPDKKEMRKEFHEKSIN
ncbi:MAG: hypothetical protein DRP87_05935 [Spirochaetes bacterium]|nr:MAG: hypothetical protein DRP87_05935 [Spirochaetota bacterium]